jgi:hypothetical protein
MRRISSGLTLAFLGITSLTAQWLNYPTPGTPRTKDGKPNLSAPAPRTREGKPDFSGIWIASDYSTKYLDNLTADGVDVRMKPWAVALYKERHTYATSMLRAGVSLPALIKLLGHRTANMTLRYVEITQKDLQREFHLARVTPRHLIPLPPPAAVPSSDDVDASSVIRHMSATICALDLFRQNNTPSRDQFLACSCDDWSASAPSSKNHPQTPTPKNRHTLAGYVN